MSYLIYYRWMIYFAGVGIRLKNAVLRRKSEEEEVSWLSGVSVPLLPLAVVIGLSVNHLLRVINE
jgi:hypothetical protein